MAKGCVAKGACVSKGGMCGERGVCMAKGGVWQRGACMAKGGVRGMHNPYEIRPVNGRAVRILLECILVYVVYFLRNMETAYVRVSPP